MSVAALILIIIIGIVTYRALQDRSVFERLLFRPYSILVKKEWYRMVSSAFVHVDVWHYAMNIVCLASFAELIEWTYGFGPFLVIFFGSVIGGSLLSLYFHRNHDYTAVGASGGVSGVVFANIALFPDTAVGIILIPIYIPGWVFAAAYLLFSFYGIRKQLGNIGHDAHFGGALTGVFIALIVNPNAIVTQPLLISGIIIGSIIMLFILAKDPTISAGTIFGNKQNQYKPSERYQDYDLSLEKGKKREEIDTILEKISELGFDSLTARERKILDAYSRKRG